MGNIECTTDDLKEAAVYFQKYMSLRNMLLRGQLEREDFEDYMTYQGRKLSKKAEELAEIMADGVAEDMAKMQSRALNDTLDMIQFLLDEYKNK